MVVLASESACNTAATLKLRVSGPLHACSGEALPWAVMAMFVINHGHAAVGTDFGDGPTLLIPWVHGVVMTTHFVMTHFITSVVQPPSGSTHVRG